MAWAPRLRASPRDAPLPNAATCPAPCLHTTPNPYASSSTSWSFVLRPDPISSPAPHPAIILGPRTAEKRGASRRNAPVLGLREMLPTMRCSPPQVRWRPRRLPWAALRRSNEAYVRLQPLLQALLRPRMPRFSSCHLAGMLHKLNASAIERAGRPKPGWRRPSCIRARFQPNRPWRCWRTRHAIGHSRLKGWPKRVQPRPRREALGVRAHLPIPP
mmetsp:Transcript_40833/g.76417  ORF Transcript_40833/g.76417 Transcript_40833/m.76417 type:complete len:216 (+) Transcript_40833:84-731(+)